MQCVYVSTCENAGLHDGPTWRTCVLMCIYANPHAFGVQVLLTLPRGGMSESCLGILEAGTRLRLLAEVLETSGTP